MQNDPMEDVMEVTFTEMDGKENTFEIKTIQFKFCHEIYVTIALSNGSQKGNITFFRDIRHRFLTRWITNYPDESQPIRTLLDVTFSASLKAEIVRHIQDSRCMLPLRVNDGLSDGIG